MVNHVINSETMQHYDYEGEVYSVKLYYLEDQPIKAFASFKMDVVGFGEDHHDKNKAVIKAIKHLQLQFK